MKLYIGNPSLQIYDFSYIPPWDLTKRRIFQTIEPGQVYYVGDIDKEDAIDIIEQHKAFGLCTIKEHIKRGRRYGLVYSMDKPFGKDDLRHGIESTHEKLKEKGIENRKNTAINALAAISSYVTEADSGVEGGPSPEMSIRPRGTDEMESTITRREVYTTNENLANVRNIRGH